MTSVENAARYTNLTLAFEPELGRCTLPVREILSWGPGSLIKLSRAVGSSVDVLVGDAPFGTGELVRVADVLAVRMTTFHGGEPKTKTEPVAPEPEKAD